jgi:hypothetical protein
MENRKHKAVIACDLKEPPRWLVLIVSVNDAIDRYNKLLEGPQSYDILCELHYLKKAIYHDKHEFKMINELTGIFN